MTELPYVFIYLQGELCIVSKRKKERTLVPRDYAAACARVYVGVHFVLELELFTKRVSGMCRAGYKEKCLMEKPPRTYASNAISVFSRQ